MTTITAVRPLLVGGVRVPVGAQANVSDALAQDLVWRGDATAVLPTPPMPLPDTTILITKDQILNVTLGAADSGGVGYKVLRVPNATP